MTVYIYQFGTKNPIWVHGSSQQIRDWAKQNGYSIGWASIIISSRQVSYPKYHDGIDVDLYHSPSAALGRANRK